MDSIEQLPEVIEKEKHSLSPIEKKLNTLRAKVLDMVTDATNVIHAAIQGNEYNGKKITRSQIFAASPVVSKFAPTLEQAASGQVHLHLNIPRPKTVEAITVESKESAPKDKVKGLTDNKTV